MAKQGLTKSGFKDQIGLKLERTRREEKGKREKKRKKKKKERRSSQASQRYGTWIFGMKTNLDYEFHEIWHVSLGLYDGYFAQT